MSTLPPSADHGTLDLDRGALHAWTAAVPARPTSAQAEACRLLLSEAERLRETRFHRNGDRVAYVWTRALTRRTLSRYAAVAPADWRFAEEPFGKPSIASAEGAGLAFSVSHTPGMAVLLLARERQVGVDVEHEGRALGPDLGAVLGPREFADMRLLPEARRLRRALEHWTLKEAYAKACATGLELPLGRRQFLIESGRVHGLLADDDPDPRLWWLSLPALAPGFVTAVAASRRAPDEPAPCLTAFTVPPLGS
jgi:4'-phosphopantetheinyl transferase